MSEQSKDDYGKAKRALQRLSGAWTEREERLAQAKGKDSQVVKNTLAGLVASQSHIDCGCPKTPERKNITFHRPSCRYRQAVHLLAEFRTWGNTNLGSGLKLDACIATPPHWTEDGTEYCSTCWGP